MKTARQKRGSLIIIPVITVMAILFSGAYALADVKNNYTIQRGDNLTKIAKKLYGNAHCWPILASVPNNNIDFQGYIYPNQKITVPPQSTCDDVQDTVKLNMQPIKQKNIANVKTQPWHEKSLLIDDYIEGHYRDYSEFESIDRADTTMPISDQMFEWFNTPGNGSYPMYAFSEVSKLFSYGYEKIDSRRYTHRINNIPFSSNEQTQADRMSKRVADYVTVGDKVKETIEYNDDSHWGVSIQPKDEPLSSFFVIDGVKTDTYYHANRLTIFSDGSWAFRYQQTSTACETKRYDNCPGAWFIKTSSKEYGPYNNVSPPIPTVNKDIYFWVNENNRYVLYKNGIVQGDWQYVDLIYYTKNGNDLVFRAREGDLWYVVINGQKNQEWDYVDLISVNQKTGSVFYRARNKAGEWFMVKNNRATKTPFEPTNILFNAVLDEPIATETTDQWHEIVGIFWSNNYWKYNVPVRLVAVDSKGNLLFQSTVLVKVATRDEKGEQLEVCSSSTCNFNYVYWINNKRIGEATFRMLPLFSQKTATGQTAFYYEGNERVFKYYGVVITPAFDNKDQLIIYAIGDGILKKMVYSSKW